METSQQLDPSVVSLVKAIRKVESGGSYDASGASGEGGAFQFMPSTWRTYAAEILGNPNAPMTKLNQNEVVYKKVAAWKAKGFNVGQIASMWNAGEGRPNAYKENWKGINSQGVAYDTPSYALKVANAYQEFKSLVPATTPQATSIVPPAPAPVEKKGFLKSVMGALISSEKAFGEDIATALITILPKSWTGLADLESAQMTHQQTLEMALKGLQKAKDTGADTKPWLKMVGDVAGTEVPTIEDLYPALKKSNLQIAGDAAGVLLDIVTAGTYGKAAKTGALVAKEVGIVEKAATKIGIPTTEKVVTKAATTAPKLTLKEYAKISTQKALQSAAIGGGIGYGYDVTNKLQEGKTGAEALTPGLGTAVGVVLPLAGLLTKLGIAGAAKGVTSISEGLAPKIINGLVKPKTANFAYGKNPGRTVSEMGITGKSLDDFGKNVSSAKSTVGEEIGKVYSNPANSGISIDITEEMEKLDKAMEEAAKGGKNNQNIVKTLNNLKEALLFEHVIDPKTGEIVRVEGKGFRTQIDKKTGKELQFDPSKMNPEEAFAFKQVVASHTQFKGIPSDDKAINAVLKDMYRGITTKLNNAVSVNNPEITKLNERYGDLVSAELAIWNREQILQRNNLISLRGTLAGVGGAIMGAAGGGIGSILGAAKAIAIERALESTAVQTRIASWLAQASKSEIEGLLIKNPEVGHILLKFFSAKVISDL
ncbi:MAG: lytic transglycosylase domain-containing protein [Methanogenium sp.]|jgi:hypothetical protein